MSSLGKGLSALISENATDMEQEHKVAKSKGSTTTKSENVPYKEVSIDKIEANPFQPRMVITDESLTGLVESIKEHGFFSPIIVKQKEDDKFIIIAGERRWRAAIIAGVKKIPVVINKGADSKLTELAIVENIQRKDLNPIEEAAAYDHLRREYGLNATQISKKMGFSQEYISNKLKLLRLPVSIQELILQERLTPQHTDSLEKLGNEAAMLAVSKMILRDRLSADKTADLVLKLMNGMGMAQTTAKPNEEFRQRFQYIIDGFKDKLGSKATLLRRPSGGATLSISFGNDAEIKEFYKKIDHLIGEEPNDLDTFDFE